MKNTFFVIFLSITILLSIVIVVLLSIQFLKQKQEPYHDNYEKLFRDLIKRPIDPVTLRYYKKIKQKNVIVNDILQYSKEIESGRQILQQKNVIVAGLVYNAETLVPKIEKWFNDLTKLCATCHIVIVENNSIDNTSEYLNLWKLRDPDHLHLVCEEGECKSFENVSKDMLKSAHRNRIEKMAYLRNKYLKYIRENFEEVDYVFVTDMDLDGTLYWDGVFQSIFKFYVNPDIEVIACNGIVNGSFLYYDSFAYAKDKNEIRWSTTNDKHSHDQDVLQNISRHYQNNLEMDKVASAFGGFSIYDFNSFVKHEYNFYKEGYSCEHCLFHENFDNIQVNPRMLYLIFENKT